MGVHLKIAALLSTYRPSIKNKMVGGGELSNISLLEKMAENGNIVTVYTLNGLGVWRSTVNGVKIYDFGFLFKGGRFKTFSGMIIFKALCFYMVKKNKPDILISSTQTISFTAKIAEDLNIINGAFIRAYENFTLYKNPLKRLLHGFIMGRSDADALKKVDFLIPNSEFMEKFLKKKLGDKIKTHIVYPSVKKAQTFSPPSEIKKILMVGTSKKKGVDTFTYLAERFSNINFIIVGDPALKPAEKLKINNLTRIGWSDNVPELIHCADCVLVPSTWEEPFGRISLEALFSGKPVLVSDRGGLPETVMHNKNLIIKYDKKEDWYLALGKLINKPEDFILSENELAIVYQKYSLSVITKDFECFLKKEFSIK